MQAVQFFFVMTLLLDQLLGQAELLVKNFRHIVGFTFNLPHDSAHVGAQTFDLLAHPVHLSGVSIATSFQDSLWPFAFVTLA